jgi:hypothetical protein
MVGLWNAIAVAAAVVGGGVLVLYLFGPRR